MQIKNFTLNFGPQHPAAHGVLRLILHLKGEAIEYIDPHIGLLHRGTEKLMEQKNYIQSIPYMDRLDYVSTISQEHTYCLAIEQLLQLNLNTIDSFFRIILLELTRILNHLMAITTHALDLGALSPFLWGFEEREKIMEFYERLCGARLHANVIRPGGLSFKIHWILINDIYYFCKNFIKRTNELETLLSLNKIWIYRLNNIGIITKKIAKSFGFSGILLRSTGIPYDLRETQPYEIYNSLPFSIYTSKKGDCLDRYFLRINEMRESAIIVIKTINFLKLYLNKTQEKKQNNFFFKKLKVKQNMEEMIVHFKHYSKYNKNIHKTIYTSTEAPKGEFGILISSNGKNTPNRCRIRSPGFFHLQGINSLAKRHFLGDLVAIIGTLDIVFGEVDR